jgi:hypothetical protein
MSLVGQVRKAQRAAEPPQALVHLLSQSLQLLQRPRALACDQCLSMPPVSSRAEALASACGRNLACIGEIAPTEWALADSTQTISIDCVRTVELVEATAQGVSGSAASWWAAMATMIRPTPRTSIKEGICVRTTIPTTIAVAGSKDTIRE